ncbi:unnamed protein product [Phaedon cochleariae]|uniref:DPY30 domain-containing protein 1 n=1 Tax=Phaedon cochleariae TaxID=80249 RepID=A0A9N9SF37_PHACE|nr:unnamed protein product [Phaedon cochleariae]
MATKSSQELSHHEALDQDLLNNMHHIFSSVKLIDTPEQDSTSLSESRSSRSSDRSKMSSEDVAYLKENLGTPLTLALAEISAVQPRDPIHYLGHWLFKYRYNEEVRDVQRIEVEQLTEARDKLAKEKWHAFVEKEAKAAVFDMIARAEEEALENELLRIEKELADQEEEDLDYEARDKFEAFGGDVPI